MQRFESRALGLPAVFSAHRVWEGSLQPVTPLGSDSRGSRSGQGALKSILQFKERQFMRREDSVKRSRARSGSHALVAHNYAFKRTAGTGHGVS